jgi:hypothetical protein
MGRELRRGDRIRVQRTERTDKYAPGDKGTVLSGPYVPAQGEPYYVVAMDDDDDSPRPCVFTALEIELETGPVREMPPVVRSRLKKGDRVRVTRLNRMYGYQPGDKGTITREAIRAPSGTRYYLVAMDKDNPAHTGVVFNAEEIEADE